MEGFLLLFLIVAGLSGVLSQCNRLYGPSGVTECIQITTYNNQYQWATCLTDTYIRAKSNNKHACIDRTTTYCYYQCMLESFGEEDGSVYSACSCKLGDAYREKNLTLPSECYSPSGTSCDWYLECLHKKYPCSQTGDDYALTYATKFCELYEKHYSGFSGDGQKWVDSVRKCLQVTLVPYIRPYSHLSCAEVKKVAFESHVPCYVTPDEQDNNVTICNLSLDDFFKILFTIKSSYFISVESSFESLDGLFTTMKNCSSFNDLEFSNNSNFRNVKLKVAYDSNSSRKRRSADDASDLKRANDIGNHIANLWWFDDVTWFTFAANSSNSELEFNILLAGSSQYVIDYPFFERVDLNRVVDNLQDQLVNGKITSSKYNLMFHALSLSSCSDVDCKNVTAHSVAPPTTTYVAPLTTPLTTQTVASLNSKEPTFCIRQILGQLILCFLIVGNFVGI